MANNEIKFVFVGDTADFDKAIDSIIKKANKAKDIDKDANKVRKQAVNLEKILKDEYEQAAKNAGSLKSITEKLAREEAKRLEIAKKLSDESLTQKQRQGLVLDLAKSNARSGGLKKAGVAGMGKLAGAAVLGAIAAGVGSAIAATMEAVNNAQAIRSGALQAGQSVEQFQINEFAKGLNRSPKEIGESLEALGVIIDENLNKKLADSGDQIKIAFAMVKNTLIPIFAVVATKLAEFALDIAAVMKAISKTGIKQTAKAAAGGLMRSGLLGPLQGIIASVTGFGETEGEGFIDNFAEERAKIQSIIDNLLDKETKVFKQGPAMQDFGDSLSRIGLFKQGPNSQIDLMKKNIAELEKINKNTRELKPAIEDA